MGSLIKSIVYSESQKNQIELILSNNIPSVKIWELDEIDELKKEIRNFYRKEQKLKCAYCRNPISVVYPQNCHIEHIAPKSIYPQYIFEPQNLCVICVDCNLIKRNQETVNEVPNTIKKKKLKNYPKKSDNFLIVHPHFDNYDDHIYIINGFYIDKASKKGNFTIGACLLNRKFKYVGWEPTIIDENRLLNALSDFIIEPDKIKRDLKLNIILKDIFSY